MGDIAMKYLPKGNIRPSPFFSAMTLLLASSTAIGWIFHIPVLTYFHSSLPAMQPITAIGLMMCALAILLTKDSANERKNLLLIFILSSMASFFGLLILADYAFDLNLQLIIQRPAPQASLNFLFIGLAILIYNFRPKLMRLGQIFLILPIANAIIVLTGYIFSTKEFYGFPLKEDAIGMAVHTALGFIFLAFALLFKRPNEGMMALLTSEMPSGRMARRIFFTGILAPPIVGVLTRIGLAAGWYNINVQISLFATIIVGLLLRKTWKAAQQAEKEELLLKQALEERQIFSSLIENASDFIGIADVDGKPVYVNPAGRRMVGLSADYPIEKTQIPEYYTPDQRDFATNVIMKAMIEKDYWLGETFFRNWQTNEAIPVSDQHFMIRETGTRKLLGMGTITRDITEIKKAQELIRQTKERFELALWGGNLGAWDWNIKTGEVVFNSRWAERRGYKLEEIKPEVESWIKGIHPEDLPHVKKILDDYLGGIVAEYEVEFRVLTKTGAWIWILDRGKIFTRDNEGKPIRMVGTELDITQQKQIQILNEKLFKESQQATKIRENVLAIVSHDLKNPLSAVSLLTQLMGRSKQLPPEKIKDFAEKIQASVSQMQLLIGDLSDFSKIQSGTFSVVMTPTFFREALKTIIDQHKIQAEQKGQTIEVENAADSAILNLDLRRICQVLSNLLGNAIKFTPEGGKIRLKIIEEKDNLMVSVSDNGPGIPQEQLPKIFERFWQAEKTKHLGSGLGLSIAKGIVEAHGGKIWAESQLGVGTSFYFMLPLLAHEVKIIPALHDIPSQVQHL